MPTLRERVVTAINPATNTTTTVVAGAAGSAGLAVMAGTAAPLVAAVGFTALTGGLALIGLGAAVVAPRAWRAIRGRSRKDASKGDEISKHLADGPNWDCHMSRVSVLGTRGTGKSTIRQRLRGRPVGGVESTPDLEYYIIDLKRNPERFAILVDTPGMSETAGDQWRAAKYSDILIFVFDHFDTREKGSNHSEVDCDRLKHHSEFVRQIFSRIKTEGKDDIKKLIMLVSKKDLWMKGNGNDTVKKWMDDLKLDILDKYSTHIPDPLPFKPFGRDDDNDLMWLLDEIQRAAV